MTIPSSKLKAPTRPKHTEAHMINHPKFQSISRGCTHIHPHNGGTFIEFQDVSRSKKLEWGLLPQGSLQAHPPHGSRLDDDGFPAAEHLATFDGMISCLPRWNLPRPGPRRGTPEIFLWCQCGFINSEHLGLPFGYLLHSHGNDHF